MNTETKTLRQDSASPTCQNCKNQFTIEPDDFSFYEKISVPPPTFCPDCRQQRRMAVRNERTLYKDSCDLCGKSIISMYSPDKPYKVYCRECWFSDKWDPLEYGVEYNWDKPFFQQYRELLVRVPQIAIAQYHTNINSDYANFIADNKNIYLSYSVLESEDVYYSRFMDKDKTCFDSFNIEGSEMVYENIDGDRNNRTSFTLRSRECIESAYLFDCSGCQNCFMSSNLRNQRYVFRNRRCSKEEYSKEINKISMGNHNQFQELKKEFKKLIRSSLHKFANFTKTINCTGDNIENSKNAHFTFDAYESENIKYSSRIIGAKEIYDMFGCATSELMYEFMAGGFGCYKTLFSMFGEATRDSNYAYWCLNSTNMFGCSGVRKKEYCIFNKQYSKEEYGALVAKIKEHMNDKPYTDKTGCVYKYGEFFPIGLSLYAYNETIAQEYMPLTKEQAERKGYSWREPDKYPYTPTMQSSQLPMDIKDVEDSIIKEVIGCNDCGRAYRIVKLELDFLRMRKIALPRKCENCRYKERFAMRNPLKLWHRQCVCDYKVRENTAKHIHHLEGRCPNEFETSYAPERKEVVYCEQCYQSEIV
ncbi:MAG: hypothetical protein KJI72_01000 [Patescibacteria group bacterium]|nr:hypothetical protein [Patescibacteria group bacterium]